MPPPEPSKDDSNEIAPMIMTKLLRRYWEDEIHVDRAMRKEHRA